MVSQTIQILEKHIGDPRLGGAIGEAIDFLSSSHIEKEEGPTGSGQSSKSVADLHAFRKRSGYYKANAVRGLDETIESLRSCDTLVRSRVIESSNGYVAIWLDDHELPLGVLIFRKNAETAR
jgi:hypothetical protein